MDRTGIVTRITRGLFSMILLPLKQTALVEAFTTAFQHRRATLDVTQTLERAVE